MKVKWSFIFADDNIAIEVLDAAEDARIAQCVDEGDEMIFITGRPRDVYIRMDAVKIILREPQDETVNQTSVLTDGSTSINQEAIGPGEAAQAKESPSA